MCIQIILHQANLDRFRVLCGQRLTKERVFSFCALRVNLRQPFSSPRLKGSQ